MMAVKLTLGAFVVLCTFSFLDTKSVPSQDDELEGYYWRHYSGHLPTDALPAGRGLNGETTYVGQIIYRNILVPGQFLPDERRVYFEWGDAEHYEDNNIKILCTKHPEQFEWIRTNTKDVGNIPNKNFILGGFEADYTVYIGRVAVGETLSIGKVIVTETQSKGFHTTYRGNATYVRAQIFEVLNYEPTIPKKDIIASTLNTKLTKGAAGKLELSVFSLTFSLALFLCLK